MPVRYRYNRNFTLFLLISLSIGFIISGGIGAIIGVNDLGSFFAIYISYVYMEFCIFERLEGVLIPLDKTENRK